jgi:hypothetical protein
MSSTTVTPMSSNAVRDPLADHLITPQNSALVLIDYQPEQLQRDWTREETVSGIMEIVLTERLLQE